MSGATLISAIHDFGTAKEVALAAGCSEDTAARYRRGETMPNPIRLARLMGRSRSITNAMLRLAGLDDVSMDLEEARLTRELSELKAKRAGRLDADTSPPSGTVARPLVAIRDRLADQATERLTRALADAERHRP